MSADRVGLTLGTLLFAVVVYGLMWKGWRGRQRRQGDLPPPAPVPDDPGPVVVGSTPGLFVGTTREGDWLDRIAVHALSSRSAGWLSLTGRGVLIEREGAPDLFLAYDVVVDARPGEALAGKVVGRDGLLLVTWVLGGTRITSGFRADDHSAHRRFADAIAAHLPGTAAPSDLSAAPKTSEDSP